MTGRTMIRPVRLALVAALLGALLATTVGVVAAAPTITASPGTATAAPGPSGTFYIPFATTSLDLDVDCGTPTSTCSVWVARNNAAKATEALFTNVTGSRNLIPVNFINDGCFNFRLYDSLHGSLVRQINVGHGGGFATVCFPDGAARPLVLFDGALNESAPGSSGIIPVAPVRLSGPVDWDSGFTGGVEDSQVWVSQSRNAAFAAYTDCNSIGYPNFNEVLYAQNVSGEKSDLRLQGGGPYCFALYSGTTHTTQIAGPVMVTFPAYLYYSSGTANPTAGLDPARGTIYFNSGNGATNALVCVHGNSIPGSDILHQMPFAYNSQGYGNKEASFQTVGAGVNKYTLHIGVGGFDANGNPTPASCQTGTTPTGAAFFVHT